MNKIIKMMAIAAGCFFLASCSDDDNPYVAPSETMQIVNGEDLNLNVNGDSKKIVVNQQPQSAVASAEWLTTAINGDTVIVTAGPNPQLASRTTLLTITAANGDKTKVTVSQYGAVVNFSVPSTLNLNDQGGTLTYEGHSTMPVEISTNADWIKADFSDDVLTITTEANNTGNARLGYVYYTAAGKTDSVKVMQCDWAKDVEGDYLFYAYNPDTQQYDTYTAQLSNDTLKLLDYGLSIPLDVDKEKRTITFTSGSYLGALSSYHCFLGFYGGGYQSKTYAGLTTTASIEFDEEEMYFYSEIDNTWGAEVGLDAELQALIILACSAQELSAETLLGNLKIFYLPVIERFGPVGSFDALSAKSFKAAKPKHAARK